MISIVNDRAEIRQLAHAHYFSSALYAAVMLGLPEALSTGSRSTPDIAQALGTQESATGRWLRFLASFGILQQEGDDAFALTSVGAHLREDHPASLAREIALFAGGETMQAWSGLMGALKTGKTAFELQFGKPLFSYLPEHPESAARFHRGWEEITRTCALQTVGAYDFDGVSTITDVGSGYGIYLATLLKASPNLRGVLFDLPFSVEGAPANLREAGVEDRVSIVTGDAEESLPPMEFAMLKSVIHVCDDEQSARILRNIALALPKGGRVLVIERVLPDTPKFHWSRLVDMTMMVMTGGRERTRSHYQRLYEAAGFALTRVIDLECGFSLIEGERR